jgi:hypothetical protein
MHLEGALSAVASEGADIESATGASFLKLPIRLKFHMQAI